MLKISLKLGFFELLIVFKVVHQLQDMPFIFLSAQKAIYSISS